jgi:hypothetical protein
MARIYRLWVKYPPGPASGLGSFPGDFQQGDHGVLYLHYDEKRWFAPPTGDSDKLAIRYLGAAAGTLSEWSGTNTELYVGNRLVGITDVSFFKTVNFQGAIGVGWKDDPSGAKIFTSALYFTREPTWADRSMDVRFGELLKRAQKYAGAEAAQLIQTLLLAIPMVYLVVSCMIALGELAPPAIAVVAGALLLVSMTPRGAEYVECLRAANAALNTTTQDPRTLDREIEEGAKALADFFRMVLEDCAMAFAGVKANQQMKPIVRAKVAEMFTKKAPAEYEQAAKSPEAQKLAKYAKSDKITQTQAPVAQAEGFKTMPSFYRRPTAELRAWLKNNGFRQVKQAAFDADGKNSNNGGSEIWIRRTPELAKHGLMEAVRIDQEGHAVNNPATGMPRRDGPVKIYSSPERPGEVFSERVGWGARRHFHKEVIPTVRLPEYCTQWVADTVTFSDSRSVLGNRPMEIKLPEQHIPLVDP